MLLRYAIQAEEQQQFHLARNDDCANRTELEFVTGETIQLISFTGNSSTEERFLCQVTGRVFKDSKSNYIQQTVCLLI